MAQFERTKIIVKDNFESIQPKWVCVVGVGGVGGACVESLVRSGIINLVIIDYDKVEITNVNRQVQATHETIGMDKTTALKNRMLLINPDVNIIEIKKFVDSSNLELLKDYPLDIVVDAIDSLQAKIELIEYCVHNQIEIITSCGMGNRIDPTLITVSRLDKTYNDPLAKRLRIECKKRRCDKIKVVFSSELPEKRPKPIGSLSYVVNVAGHVLASEVMKSLGAYDGT